MPRVALATCRDLPEPDLDEVVLLDALAAVGLEARVVAWDGDPALFDGASLVVIRSTWNYHLAIDSFLSWVGKHEGRIQNPAPVVRWNAHKRYLRDLAREGLPIVPTVWVAAGEGLDLDALAAQRGWHDVVVKPAISAASHSTRRLRGPPFDASFATELAERADVMVQPYMSSVDDFGERSIVCIDGEVSHAVRKNPRFAGGAENVSPSALPVAPEERHLAERVLSRFDERLLYARIDIVRDVDGSPLLGEVELIEPSLFLVQRPAAAERLASAIARRLGASPGGG
jgi:hypothetical protein